MKTLIRWFKNIHIFFTNAIDRTHILRTRMKIGQWQGFDGNIEDALMLGLINFVEKECGGIQYLKNQTTCMQTTKRGIERHPANKLIDAYYFAKNRYMTFDSGVESGYYDVRNNIQKIDRWTNPEFHLAMEKMGEIEEEFEKELTKHLLNIIKHRGHLWT
jgi:hypothetical protein